MILKKVKQSLLSLKIISYRIYLEKSTKGKKVFDELLGVVSEILPE